jgi:hypothetical protein
MSLAGGAGECLERQVMMFFQANDWSFGLLQGQNYVLVPGYLYIEGLYSIRACTRAKAKVFEF